jgi:cytidine deaminase
VDDANPLMEQARQAALHAYAPYSHFRVGAAVRDANGTVYMGCNVENASYGLTVCAERNAIFTAIGAGAPRPFAGLAVACIDADDGGCSPCGACRQVIWEHLDSAAFVDVDGFGRFTPSELLPHGFKL